jgi:hypothetical protein
MDEKGIAPSAGLLFHLVPQGGEEGLPQHGQNTMADAHRSQSLSYVVEQGSFEQRGIIVTSFAKGPEHREAMVLIHRGHFAKQVVLPAVKK